MEKDKDIDEYTRELMNYEGLDYKPKSNNLSKIDDLNKLLTNFNTFLELIQDDSNFEDTENINKNAGLFEASSSGRKVSLNQQKLNEAINEIKNINFKIKISMDKTFLDEQNLANSIQKLNKYTNIFKQNKGYYEKR